MNAIEFLEKIRIIDEDGKNRILCRSAYFLPG